MLNTLVAQGLRKYCSSNQHVKSNMYTLLSKQILWGEPFAVIILSRRKLCVRLLLTKALQKLKPWLRKQATCKHKRKNLIRHRGSIRIGWNMPKLRLGCSSSNYSQEPRALRILCICSIFEKYILSLSVSAPDGKLQTPRVTGTSLGQRLFLDTRAIKSPSQLCPWFLCEEAMGRWSFHPRSLAPLFGRRWGQVDLGISTTFMVVPRQKGSFPTAPY